MIYRKTTDTTPIDRTLERAPGDPYDLTGATVTFAMRRRSDGETITGTCTLIDAEAGQVRTTLEEQPDEGLWDAEWTIEYSGGEVETVPNFFHEQVRVSESIPVA